MNYQVDDTRDLPVQIERQMINEWLPLIGSLAFSMWCMYATFSTVSVRRMSQFLSTGSRQVRTANELLKICGLITVTQGNHSIPNTVRIHSPKSLTPERMIELSQSAYANRLLSQPYSRTDLERFINALENWQPFATELPQPQPQPQPHKDLPIQTETETDNTNDIDPLEERLIAIGVSKRQLPKVRNEIGEDIERAMSWLDHMLVDMSGLTNPPGFFRHVMADGQEPPNRTNGAVKNICLRCKQNEIAVNEQYCKDCYHEMGIVI